MEQEQLEFIDEEIARWELAISDMMICYVLIRTDVPNFMWGKTCAQAHHCGTQMTEEKIGKNFPDLDMKYREWQSDPIAELAYAKFVRDMTERQSLKGYSDAMRETDKAEQDRLKKEVSLSTRTFGTVLTLAVTAGEMRQCVNLAQLLGLHAAITHDPTYPIMLDDGGQTRVVTAPVDTCAYVFARKSECHPVLSKFDLLSERHLSRGTVV